MKSLYWTVGLGGVALMALGASQVAQLEAQIADASQSLQYAQTTPAKFDKLISLVGVRGYHGALIKYSTNNSDEAFFAVRKSYEDSLEEIRSLRKDAEATNDELAVNLLDQLEKVVSNSFGNAQLVQRGLMRQAEPTTLMQLSGLVPMFQTLSDEQARLARKRLRADLDPENLSALWILAISGLILLASGMMVHVRVVKPTRRLRKSLEDLVEGKWDQAIAEVEGDYSITDLSIKLEKLRQEITTIPDLTLKTENGSHSFKFGSDAASLFEGLVNQMSDSARSLQEFGDLMSVLMRASRQDVEQSISQIQSLCSKVASSATEMETKSNLATKTLMDTTGKVTTAGDGVVDDLKVVLEQITDHAGKLAQAGQGAETGLTQLMEAVVKSQNEIRMAASRAEKSSERLSDSTKQVSEQADKAVENLSTLSADLVTTVEKSEKELTNAVGLLEGSSEALEQTAEKHAALYQQSKSTFDKVENLAETGDSAIGLIQQIAEQQGELFKQETSTAEQWAVLLKQSQQHIGQIGQVMTSLQALAKLTPTLEEGLSNLDALDEASGKVSAEMEAIASQKTVFESLLTELKASVSGSEESQTQLAAIVAGFEQGTETLTSLASMADHLQERLDALEALPAQLEKIEASGKTLEDAQKVSDGLTSIVQIFADRQQDFAEKTEGMSAEYEKQKSVALALNKALEKAVSDQASVTEKISKLESSMADTLFALRKLPEEFTADQQDTHDVLTGLHEAMQKLQEQAETSDADKPQQAEISAEDIEKLVAPVKEEQQKFEASLVGLKQDLIEKIDQQQSQLKSVEALKKTLRQGLKDLSAQNQNLPQEVAKPLGDVAGILQEIAQADQKTSKHVRGQLEEGLTRLKQLEAMVATVPASAPNKEAEDPKIVTKQVAERETQIIVPQKAKKSLNIRPVETPPVVNVDEETQTGRRSSALVRKARNVVLGDWDEAPVADSADADMTAADLLTNLRRSGEQISALTDPEASDLTEREAQQMQDELAATIQELEAALETIARS